MKNILIVISIIATLVFISEKAQSQDIYIPVDSTAPSTLSWVFYGGSFQSYGCMGMDPTYWMSGAGKNVIISFYNPEDNPSIRVWGMNDDDTVKVYVNGFPYVLDNVSASYDTKVVCNTSYGSPGPDGVIFSNGMMVGANDNQIGNWSYQNVTIKTNNVSVLTIESKHGAGWGVCGVTVERGGNQPEIYGNADVCAGNEVEYSIDPVPGALSYTWSIPAGWTGSSTNSIIVVTAAPTSGSMSVVANYADSSSAPFTLAVTGHPIPAAPEITTSGDILFSSVTAVEYQWYYNNGIITGAESKSHVATEQGFYQVEITDANGCIVKSDSLYVKPSDVDEINNSAEVVVYPNPTSGNIIVELEDYMFCRIGVIDLTGQIIELVSVESFRTELSLGSLSEGLYFIMVINDKGTRSFKLLKQ